MEEEKLLVSKSSVKYVLSALADMRRINADYGSEFTNGYANGIEYALRVLGLNEEDAKS
jgi:hypothetical protein